MPSRIAIREFEELYCGEQTVRRDKVYLSKVAYNNLRKSILDESTEADISKVLSIHSRHKKEFIKASKYVGVIQTSDGTTIEILPKIYSAPLDNHNDIKRMTDMLIGYNVDISTASSISELTELLRSDKTFDLVFLSNTISGIENYNIDTDDDLKRTFTKLSLVAGYKLQIVIVSLYDYKKNDIEFLLMPISKVELDDIMVKYLSEK